MAQYLVTGGAGFIGSHMVEALMCMDLQKILQREISPLFGPP
jgi:nucleoside-diphosphate-sugar epimerase